MVRYVILAQKTFCLFNLPVFQNLGGNPLRMDNDKEILLQSGKC